MQCLRLLALFSDSFLNLLFPQCVPKMVQYSLSYKNLFYKNNARHFLENGEGHFLKNILIVDKNVGKFKNMGEGKLGKLEGNPEKADSYSQGNTVKYE